MGRRTAISLLSCVLALAFASCGSNDGTIPQDESETLLTLLAATEGAISDGECEQAQSFAEELVAETSDLPSSVDPDVAGELTSAAENLDQLANDPDSCTETGATGETGETSTTSTTSTTTTAEPEVETTTDTTTTEPETTTLEEPETTETQTEPPTGNQGGGNPGGNPPSTGGGGVEPPSGGVSGGRR